MTMLRPSSPDSALQKSCRGVERQEWIWVAVVSIIIVAGSTVPYLTGWLAQTPQVRFDGAVLDSSDYHSHLAKMWQGYRGDWCYRLLFTPENHRGAYVQTFYVALGHLARVSTLGLAATYQVARTALGMLMLTTVYRFIAHFVLPIRLRRIGFLLATLASGLGWIEEILSRTLPGGVSPMSFWLIDGYLYLSLMTFPHFCLAITLLLAIFLLLLRHSEGPSAGDGLMAALLSLGLGLIHPYMLLVADLVPALYWIIAGFGTRRMWRGLLTAAGMVLMQTPILAYDAWVFHTQPVFANWSVQNVTLSPPPQVYLWGYGLLLILCAAGVRAHKLRRTRQLSFLWLWMGLVAVLIYLPWNLQRRFLEGLQVPLGILAAVGLTHLAGRLSNMRLKRVLPAAVVAIGTVGNLYVTAGLTMGVATRHPALFWSQELLAAVDWLGEHATWNQTILSAPETGSLIPARIGHRVVVGHSMETVEFETKRAAVARFYDTETSVSQRELMVDEWAVDYVFHGPHEKSLGEFDPGSAAWLVPEFRRGQVAVYRVSPGETR